MLATLTNNAIGNSINNPNSMIKLEHESKQVSKHNSMSKQLNLLGACALLDKSR